MMKKYIALVTLAATVAVSGAVEFHVSPEGSDEGEGTKAAPFKTLVAAQRAVLKVLPKEEPITVWIDPGHYPITETLQFGPEFRGSKKAPIRFRASGDAPVFDGGRLLPVATARPLGEQDELSRFAPQARQKISVLKVDDPELKKLLSSASCRMSFSGKMMRIASYPNSGFGHVDRILEKGAEYAHGRTKGAPPKSTYEKPVGGLFTVLDKDVSAWGEELKRVQKARVEGYLSHDWYRERHPIASVKDGKVRLLDYSRYGIVNPHKIPRRFKAINLLCELDAPGEFYFDGSQLFFIAPAPLDEGDDLSIWFGPAFMEIDGATGMSFENLIIEGVGKGKAAVRIKSGDHIRLAGCTLRNMSRPAVLIEKATYSGLQSCDLYDLPAMLTLDGGDTKTLVPGHNYAVNCHFSQVAAESFYGNIRIQGVGQVFRNNLVHNFPGQVITVGFNDHLIEKNELFNIGYEEGDGGAMYSGAAMWSWGNVFRHNFLHHLMCIPQTHPRGGIYPDDLDQGDTITQNVFYKAAHRAVLINGGAGHTVTENLFLKGHIGIYNTEGHAKKAFDMLAKYDSGELKRGDKDDRIWRTEQVIGKEGWNKEPYASHYPRFKAIMNQPRKRFYPIDCDFSNNRFSGNFRNIEYRFAGGEKGIKDVATVPFIKSTGNRDISMDVFKNPAVLDFNYRHGVDGMPAIPFDQIGLHKDVFRPNPPNKTAYRKRIAEHFKGQKSYDENARYDAKKIANRAINTGRMLQEMAASEK